MFQKHWIGVVPMEAELNIGTHATPGVASRAHATAALAQREGECFSGSRPGSLGLFHTGCGGGADRTGDFEIFSLTMSIQAVGEGNYGRLGPDGQQRYTDANAETMFSEPAIGGTPDKQPGAMPEIFPSTPTTDPGSGIPPNIDRCWTCRSMVMQAWGNYGTAWSVVHQQLGVSPFLGDGALRVVPEIAPGQPSVAGSNIRLGDGEIDASAYRLGANAYRTRLTLHGLRPARVEIGYTLPTGATPASVVLDGQRLRHYAVTDTNRGVEVTAAVHANGPARPHTLIVTSA